MKRQELSLWANTKRPEDGVTKIGDNFPKLSLEEWSYVNISELVRRRKRIAREAVKQALKAGILTKEPCRDCGDEKSEAHHPDYTWSLFVVWLCRKHHMALHKEANEINRYITQIRRWKMRNGGLYRTQ